jgi:cytochrome c oxidase assembly protein subunit 15
VGVTAFTIDGVPRPSRRSRLLAGLDSRLRPSPTQLRGFAIASLVANIAIVVTGGAVRLTSSGLGCPSWPTCTPDSLVPTSEYGVHGLIEYGNRILTFVVASVVLATLVAAYRARPPRRDVRRLALVLFLGIPSQGVIGGITVLTHLNPWTVMGHFLLSMVLVGLATVLVRRAGEGDDPPRVVVHPVLRRLALALLGVVAVVLSLGTVVTGSGPHAGDETARRTGLDP